MVKETRPKGQRRCGQAGCTGRQVWVCSEYFIGRGKRGQRWDSFLSSGPASASLLRKDNFVGLTSRDWTRDDLCHWNLSATWDSQMVVWMLCSKALWPRVWQERRETVRNARYIHGFTLRIMSSIVCTRVVWKENTRNLGAKCWNGILLTFRAVQRDTKFCDCSCNFHYFLQSWIGCIVHRAFKCHFIVSIMFIWPRWHSWHLWRFRWQTCRLIYQEARHVQIKLPICLYQVKTLGL